MGMAEYSSHHIPPIQTALQSRKSRELLFEHRESIHHVKPDTQLAQKDLIHHETQSPLTLKSIIQNQELTNLFQDPILSIALKQNKTLFSAIKSNPSLITELLSHPEIIIILAVNPNILKRAMQRPSLLTLFATNPTMLGLIMSNPSLLDHASLLSLLAARPSLIPLIIKKPELITKKKHVIDINRLEVLEKTIRSKSTPQESKILFKENLSLLLSPIRPKTKQIISDSQPLTLEKEKSIIEAFPKTKSSIVPKKEKIETAIKITYSTFIPIAIKNTFTLIQNAVNFSYLKQVFLNSLNQMLNPILLAYLGAAAVSRNRTRNITTGSMEDETSGIIKETPSENEQRLFPELKQVGEVNESKGISLNTIKISK